MGQQKPRRRRISINTAIALAAQVRELVLICDW
jgi:hypothetical protein